MRDEQLKSHVYFLHKALATLVIFIQSCRKCMDRDAACYYGPLHTLKPCFFCFAHASERVCVTSCSRSTKLNSPRHFKYNTMARPFIFIINVIARKHSSTFANVRGPEAAQLLHCTRCAASLCPFRPPLCHMLTNIWMRDYHDKS